MSVSQLTLIRCLFWICILIGISLRLWFSTVGYNFDLDSYRIVSDAFLNNESVYAATSRYNYGPIWFFIVGLLRRFTIAVTVDDIPHFHVIIAAFLTLIDGVIAFTLRDKYGTAQGLFFFLNPVSIMITGYHSQFDCLAVLCGFLACLYLLPLPARDDTRRFLCGTLLLGFSLTIKHILLFFPIWLWWQNRDLSVKRRLVVLLLPYALFGLSLAPYMLELKSRTGVIENIALYSGGEGGRTLVYAIVEFFTEFPFSENALHFSVPKTTFVLVTIFSGMIWNLRRRRTLSIVDLFFIYLITLVAFSSSVGNQYFAIPLISVAHYYKRVAFWMYSLTATVWIMINRNAAFSEMFSGIKGLFPSVAGIEYYYVQVWLVLLLAGIWWRSRRAERLETF